MAANRDEALKCIGISQRHLSAGNFPSARRFAEKSIALFPTPEAKQLLERISVQESEPSSSSGPSSSNTNGSAAKASGASAHETSGTTHQRHAGTSSSASTSNGSASSSSEKKRDFTPEQVAVVKRIRKCKVTQYYEIMGLEKACEENDVKKAYRKLALQLHPDKNGAPGADEAFKMVSKAFQILSDPQKRAAFDQHGDDPDSRYAGMSAAQGFEGFGGGGGGATFQGEMTPEELFNMFFGGGGMQGGFGQPGFGGPGVFTATFGPGGFRTMRTGAMPRRQAGNQADQNRNQLLQLLPVIIIFLLPVLSSLLSSLFGSTPIPDPAYSFQKNSQYSITRLTTPHKVPYYVNPASWQAHPIYETIPVNVRGEKQAGPKANSRQLNAFETRIEDRFAASYYSECQREHQKKERDLENARGFFGIGADLARLKEVQARKLESCEVLKRHGFIS